MFESSGTVLDTCCFKRRALLGMFSRKAVLEGLVVLCLAEQQQGSRHPNPSQKGSRISDNSWWQGEFCQWPRHSQA